MSSRSPNLRQVQKRTMRLMNFDDGLWDLMLGTMFMMLAIYPVTRARLGPAWNAALFIVLLLLLVAIQLFVRQQLAIPRIGYAKPKRSPALRWIVAINILLVILTFGLIIWTLALPVEAPNVSPAPAVEGQRSYLVEIVVLLAMVGIFSALGYLFGVPRLYLYGWLLGGGNLASVIANRGAPEAFNLPAGVAAAIIMLIGLTLLYRFIRRYPVRVLEG